MRNIRKIILAGSLALAACSDLKVDRLADSESQTSEPGRLVYYLPRTAIDITLTVALTRCDSKRDKHGIMTIAATKTVAAVPTTEADPQYRYSISYPEAETWTKEVNFAVNTYSNKTLQSFNGQINDQAGPIAVAALSAAVQIAGAAFIPGTPALHAAGPLSHSTHHASAPPPAPLCTSKVIEALQEIDKQKAIIKANSAATANATVAAERTAKIASAQTEIARITKANDLTRTASLHWVPGGDVAPPEAGPGSVVETKVDPYPLIAEWLTSAGANELDTMGGASWQSAKAPIAVSIALDRATEGNSAANVTFGPDGKFSLDHPGGLVVRDPAKGTMRICDAACPYQAEGTLAETTDELAVRQTLWLPQFGQLRVFPERSRLFENATLAVSMNADGTIASAGYHSLSTAATGFTGVATAAGQAAAAETAHNSAVTAANTAATTQASYADTVNKSLADCLVQQAAILKAGGKPVNCQ